MAHTAFEIAVGRRHAHFPRRQHTTAQTGAGAAAFRPPLIGVPDDDASEYPVVEKDQGEQRLDVGDEYSKGRKVEGSDGW